MSKLSAVALAVLAVALVHCAAPAGEASGVDDVAAAASVPAIKVDASGSVHVKKGNGAWKQHTALQSFEPDLPGGPGAARIMRDGEYEFVWFSESKLARFKDLATGAVTAMKAGAFESEPLPGGGGTRGVTHFTIDASAKLDVFEPVDTGELTRIASGATKAGTLPSVPNAKKLALVKKAKAMLSAGTYRGVTSTGDATCEVVTIADDEGIQFEIFSVKDASRRRLVHTNFSTEYVDGSLEVGKKFGLQNLGTTVIIDATSKLSVEVTDVLGSRRICKELKAAQ